MDWIKLSTHKPTLGATIFVKDYRGDAVLGIADIKGGDIVLNDIRGFLLVSKFELWATYEVEY